MAEYREVGRINYEAWSRTLGVFRPWDALTLDEQEAWREAARQVMRLGWSEAQKSPARHRRTGDPTVALLVGERLDVVEEAAALPGLPFGFAVPFDRRLVPG